MLGLLYVAESLLLGYCLIYTAFPMLFDEEGRVAYFGEEHKLSSIMVIIPAAYFIGTMVETWTVYIFSYIYRFQEKPLFYGNIWGMVLAAFACLLFLILRKNRNNRVDVKLCSTEIFYILTALVLSSFLMLYTFDVKDGNIRIGYSVYSDFGPHLSLIRLFSKGLSFPTEYPHFPDGHIRYHFMFDFLAGNLEYLGMRIDWAFNLPSIISMVSFLMLLYSLLVIMTGERGAGILTAFLFMFRSSFAFLTYIRDFPGLKSALSAMLNNGKYIGKTLHEEWGLWTQNVFANQRHFSFSLGILVFMIIMALPLMKMLINSMRDMKGQGAGRRLKEFLYSADAWKMENIKAPVCSGIIIGLMGFWNGAVVIALLIILFVMAIFSKRRLEYLTAALIAVLLCLLETRFFMGSGTGAVNIKLFVGFLSEGKSISSIMSYYIELLGILPLVILLGIFYGTDENALLSGAFLCPLIFATLFQLTPDITVNHKYVMISVMLLGILGADFLIRLFSSRKALKVFLAFIITLFLTATGIVDLITFYNINKEKVVINQNDPIIIWAQENTHPGDIFLSDAYCLHPILLAGRKIFYGWPYFAWSAGYNTAEREKIVSEIYSCSDEKRIRELVKENKIDYIVIDDGNRNSKLYILNEGLIKQSFQLVFKDDSSRTFIYKTH